MKPPSSIKDPTVTDAPGPDRIWLEPECCGRGREEGRLWCEDNVWPDTGDCEQSGVEYIRADLAMEAKPDPEGLREAATAVGSALDDWIKIIDIRAPLNPDLKHYFWKRDPTWDEAQEAMRANNALAAALSAKPSLEGDEWRCVNCKLVVRSRLEPGRCTECSGREFAHIVPAKPEPTRTELVEALKQAVLDLHEAAGRFAIHSELDLLACSELTREAARQADAVLSRKQSGGGSTDA